MTCSKNSAISAEQSHVIRNQRDFAELELEYI